jgi:hypothetical protein
LSSPSVIRQNIKIDEVQRVSRPQDAKGTKTEKWVTGLAPADAYEMERQAIANRAQIDQAKVELANSQIDAQNTRVYDVLETATGESRPREATSWWTWWQEYNQRYWPKPTRTFYEASTQTYTAQINTTERTTGSTWHHSCFLAGTPVRTETGSRAIETIKLGDRVLAQDAETGELAYKVVLKTTVRPPTTMVRLTLGEDQLVTTISHPFWVVGKGWTLARELKTGDLAHTLGGAVRIDQIEPVADDKAYNLVVDEFNTYFVGVQGVLVHDSAFRKPTQAVVPGLTLASAD